jgi:hypothetical protein
MRARAPLRLPPHAEGASTWVQLDDDAAAQPVGARREGYTGRLGRLGLSAPRCGLFNGRGTKLCQRARGRRHADPSRPLSIAAAACSGAPGGAGPPLGEGPHSSARSFSPPEAGTCAAPSAAHCPYPNQRQERGVGRAWRAVTPCRRSKAAPLAIEHRYKALFCETKPIAATRRSFRWDVELARLNVGSRSVEAIRIVPIAALRANVPRFVEDPQV